METMEDNALQGYEKQLNKTGCNGCCVAPTRSPSGLKDLFPWLLGVLPANNPLLTALSRNCPWLKRAASSKVRQPASNDWLMLGSEGLTPSPQFWKTITASELWSSLLSLCLECYHRPTSPSAQFWLHSFPTKCWYWEHLSENSVHLNLHLRICFLGNPTSKPRRYWTTAMQFHCE